VLLGSPAGPTRVISIAAYEAAFEQYDYSLGIGDRDDHGLRAADHRLRGAQLAQRLLSRSGQRRERLMKSERSWFDRAWRSLLLGVMTLFVINIGLMIAAVAVSSFARRWLGTWLPEGWTVTWYTAAWKEFQLGDVLWVTSRSCSRSCSSRS
jgi:hypothetical protein